MSWLLIALLSAVQGITEFLPISSSGHLKLLPKFTGDAYQGLLFDVAVHVGTLGAVVVYFWRDLARLAVGATLIVKGKWTDSGRLAVMLLISTLPVLVVGFLAKDFVELRLDSVPIIGWATIGFGILLYAADKTGITVRRLEHVGVSHAVILGLAQVLALVPGTSRSGITMTAARVLGYERAEAARFSMLMSIPVIFAAGVLLGRDLVATGDWVIGRAAVTAAGLSFLVALAAIDFLMKWLRRADFAPFVLYRIGLGGVVLYLYYFTAFFVPSG